jgi:hypothetical protein
MEDIKRKFLKLKDTFYQKYWHDPVWSKVIATGIITIAGSVFSAIYVLIKSLHEKVSFKSAAGQVIDYFKLTTKVNNLLLCLLLLIFFVTVYTFLKSLIADIIKKITTKTAVVENPQEVSELPTITEHSTVFFSDRLAQAFPGQRGLMWYEAKTAVERFRILFQEPLRFKSGGYDCMGDPIWWFRGNSALFIDRFRPLSKTKVLMGHEELELKRIAVYISDLYYKSFVYVEAKGEKQTGLYDFKQEDINRHIDKLGYSYEEYGLLGKKPIKRTQYDDGAAVINGKVVDATKAELRVRFLSAYNFIVAAKQSPYNSTRFQTECNKTFDDILQGKMKVELFFQYLETFKKDED